MTLTPVTTLHDIPRDRWGRPLVTPPDGGKPIGYQRCTTFIKVLDDTYNLSLWQQRMVAIGLATRPDLLLSVTAHVDDKDALNAIVEKSKEAANASAAATTGTALHAICEQIDLGNEPPPIPEAYQADMAAYVDATKDLTATHIETFSVHDDLQVGGTPDRIVDVGGRPMVADIKTGSIQYGLLSIAMQMAVYAHSKPYSHDTNTRGDWGPVDLDKAIIIHLPAGRGTCELIEVDIAKGWEAVQTAIEVWRWRKTKGLTRPFTTGTPALQVVEPVNDAPIGTAANAGPSQEYAALENRIATATTSDSIRQLWADHQPLWDQNLTDLASARTALLDQAVVR